MYRLNQFGQSEMAHAGQAGDELVDAGWSSTTTHRLNQGAQ
jgi:hypothetical protein